jgi:hypothetical protein
MDDLRFFIWQIYLFATFLPFSAVQTSKGENFHPPFSSPKWQWWGVNF